jgi:hypothetical protein
MRIEVHYVCPPVPSRDFDWVAYDDAVYGGEETDVVGHGATAKAAILDLITQTDDLFSEQPSAEPCSDANPALWKAFCAMQGRPDAPSTVWTEQDVVLHIDWLSEQLFGAKSDAK